MIKIQAKIARYKNTKVARETKSVGFNFYALF